MLLHCYWCFSYSMMFLFEVWSLSHTRYNRYICNTDIFMYLYVFRFYLYVCIFNELGSYEIVCLVVFFNYNFFTRTFLLAESGTNWKLHFCSDIICVRFRKDWRRRRSKTEDILFSDISPSQLRHQCVQWKLSLSQRETLYPNCYTCFKKMVKLNIIL